MSVSISKVACSVIIVGCTGLIRAQQSRVVPSYVESIDANSKNNLVLTPGYRSEQIIDGAQICKSSAILLSYSYRPDARPLTVSSARILNSFQVSFGYSQSPPIDKSTYFGTHRHSSIPATRVFSGNVSLPTVRPVLIGAQPWNVTIKFAAPFLYTRKNGPLLIETHCKSATSPTPAFFVDSHEQGGTGYPFGKAAPLAATEAQILPVSGKEAIPGGHFSFYSQMRIGVGGYVNIPVIVMAGVRRDRFGALKLPLDLGPLGAPRNWLHIDPIFFGTAQLSGRSVHAMSTRFPLPKGSAWIGRHIYAQAIFVSSIGTNPLGIACSNALGLRIGGEPIVTSCLTAPTASTWGIASASPVVRLEGVFY